MFSASQRLALKSLWFFLKPHKMYGALVLLLMFVSSGLESLNLAALYPIINYGLVSEVSQNRLKFFERFINIYGFQNKFVLACFMLMAITVAATLCRIVTSFLSNRLIRTIARDHQKAIFQKFATADYKFFVASQQGRLIYAGTIASIGVSNSVLYVIRILNSSITCLFFITLLFLLWRQGTLLMLAIGFLYLVFVRRVTNRIIKKFATLNVEESRRKNIILNEFITGIKSIKAFFGVSYWKDKYFKAVEKGADYNFQVMMASIFPESFIKFTFFMLFALAGILFFAGGGPQQFMTMLPLLGTFAAIASRLLPAINVIGNDYVSITRFFPDAKIVYEMLNEKMRHRTEGSKVLDCFGREIIFRNVWFKYDGMDEFLLKGISFSIAKGKKTALVGPSGSGKTSIVNLLLRLYDVDQGGILLDGVDIRDLTIESFLSKVSYVSQETFIFNGTIKDNILFGCRERAEEPVIEAAQLANAHEFILEMENGYNTVVGDAGVKLSGGQRQRIAIARAMLRKPEILILDEATSSLDNISEKKIEEAIDEISRRTTVFVIAHRLATVQNADRIVVIDKGQVVECGQHEELLRKENVYFNLYKTL